MAVITMTTAIMAGVVIMRTGWVKLTCQNGSVVSMIQRPIDSELYGISAGRFAER